jgi:carbonic anhydrase
MKTSPLNAFTTALLASCFIALTLTADPPAPSPAAGGVTPDAAMARLVSGNRRFRDDQSSHPRQQAAQREETVTQGQHPFAIVLSCSDSRVPPEMLFDQGIGDLFVVRVAGNVAATDEIATVEYGAEHLGAPLCVVMGHTRCGAVTAVVNGDHVTPNIAELVRPIVPAVESARRENPGLTGNPLIAAAIRTNVWRSISDLLTHSETVRELVRTKKLKVVGAFYDFQTGAVEFMGEHPHQAQLLALEPSEKMPAPVQ